jgi:anti-anti-sigma factor
VLTLRGDHDIATAGSLDAELEAVFLHGTSVIVDLSEAEFIDSSIIGAIFRGLQAAQSGRGGSLVVCAPPGTFPRSVFDLARLEDVVDIVDSRGAALDRFDAG